MENEESVHIGPSRIFPLVFNSSVWLSNQRSFPLTEEEYIEHLDSVANMLRGWGAVAYIRSSLAKTKERPRIGKVGF